MAVPAGIRRHVTALADAASFSGALHETDTHPPPHVRALGLLVPDADDLGRTAELAWIAAGLGAALLLADRLLVLSERPTRIRVDLRVDRPRPRRRDDATLVALREEILDLLGLPEIA